MCFWLKTKPRGSTTIRRIFSFGPRDHHAHPAIHIRSGTIRVLRTNGSSTPVVLTLTHRPASSRVYARIRRYPGRLVSGLASVEAR
jgi:hypothetical protein